MLIDDFEKYLNNIKHHGNERSAACPVCEKNDPKGCHLYYREKNGKLVMNCKHGCKYEEIMVEINPSQRKPSEQKWQFLRSHFYTDEEGNVIARKDIYKVGNGKGACWLRKEGNAFVKTLNEKKVPLYNISALVNASPTQIVYIVEGEKDVDTLTAIGYLATTSPHGTKWSNEYSRYLKGRKVIQIPDFDETGKNYSNTVVLALQGVGVSVKVLELEKCIPELPEKSDITDVYEMIGEEAVKVLLSSAEAEAEESVATEKQECMDMTVNAVSNPPAWLICEEGRGGLPKYDIDEATFIVDFKERHSLFCLNGIFYNLNGPVTDRNVGNMIQNEIIKYFKKNLAFKEKTLLAALRSVCFVELGEPASNEIFCANAKLRVAKGKPLQVSELEFSISRLAVNFNKEAPEPLIWKHFLSELLYNEDIECFQEYLGYCLIPTTIGQKCLNIVGHGGEGKSLVGFICNAIFGTTMINEKIGKIAEDRFLLSQLEGKNLFYDDDLDTKKLTDTGLFKILVTNGIEIQVERKGIDKYRLKPYARFLVCGNNTLASCFDKSDGFYRRMLIMRCRPKARNEDQDDPYLAEKLQAETEGIFQWMLVGLQRLIENDFHFSISERMTENLRQAREDDSNIIAFMRDDDNIERCIEGAIASKDLLDLYKYWCNINAEVPLADRTFLEYVKTNQDKLGIEYSDQMKLGRDGKRVRGYKGIAATEAGRNVLERQSC